MRSRNAGRIGERLWYLGREESGVYLLEGDVCSLIISGGMSPERHDDRREGHYDKHHDDHYGDRHHKKRSFLSDLFD